MDQLNQILSKLGLKSQSPYPQLPKGSDPYISPEDLERFNMELTAEKLFGIKIQPIWPGYGEGSNYYQSRQATPGFALFAGQQQVMVEIHTNDDMLQPYELSTGSESRLVPAFTKFPKSGCLHLTALWSAHVPRYDKIEIRLSQLQEQAQNPNLKNFYHLLKQQWVPADYTGGIARSLWIYAPYQYLLPLPSGEAKGLEGKLVTYPQGGPILDSIMRRSPPRFQDLTPDEVNTRHYHLEHACPDEPPKPEDKYILYDNQLYAFYKKGVVNNATFEDLSNLPLDILLQFKWLPPNELYITPLLRTSGSQEALDDITSHLTQKGGWHLTSTLQDLLYFVPGGKPIPPSYGRRKVENWSNLEEIDEVDGSPRYPLGLTQQITKKLAPTGDPSGNYVFGRVGKTNYTVNPELLAGILVSGLSKMGAKTGTVSELALELNPNLVWADYTAVNLDSTMRWASEFGGTVWYMDLPDPEDILIAEGNRNPRPDEIESLRNQQVAQDNAWIEQRLNQMLDTWYQENRITGLPLVIHPSNNTDRYLTFLSLLMNEKKLPKLTQEWEVVSGEWVQMVGNDFSHLLSVIEKGNEYQVANARAAGNGILWYLNHGFNAAVHPTWIITHSKTDPDVLSGKYMYNQFAVHLEGGLSPKIPTFEFNLIYPGTGEKLAKLNLKISDKRILQVVGRLSPQEAKALQSEIATTSTITTHPNSNGRSPSRSKERRDVRSET